MTFERLHWDETPPADWRSGALAVGNFDGVHRGHGALVAQLRRRADSLGGPAIVLSFDPHPLQLLRPQQFQPVLTTLSERARLLCAQGANHVVLLQTTPALLSRAPAEFFGRIVRDGFRARALVEGDNFRFGRDRQGDVTLLGELCRQEGITLDVVPPFEIGGVRVSSSRVRQALARGAVEEAAALLGRPYRLRGIVGTGQRRGRTIGFPTANLEALETLVPGDGVYAVRAWHAGTVWPGAANIGPNPTFAENARKVEVHLLGFQGDLYGQSLDVDFVARLRDTRPFSGVAELIAQLRTDVEQARLLAGEGKS
jgi:riboflavin kinase/FMN adenylyltransferase